MKIIYCFNFRG